jgi:Cu+-exporting ATPase
MPEEKAAYLACGGRQPPVANSYPAANESQQRADAPRSPIAFVGDGVNDAPALARAAVGIAIGTGADIAAEAGDIVMMGEPLRPLPLLVRLSRETVRVVRQNIVWFGFGVNLVGVVLTGFLWPLFATSAEWYESAPLAGVLYHQLGSLAVLLNSMRLLAFERTAVSRPLGRLRSSYAAVDRWFAAASIDDVFHAVGHYRKPIAAALGIAIFLVWLSSSLAPVSATEVGVVQRFGAVVADLGPGLHVRWPWPVETVTRLNPNEVRTVEVGFRLLSEEKRKLLEWARGEQARLRTPGGKPGVSDRDQTWSAAHAEGIARLSDESVMITGDGNLVEVLATVRYTVADSRAFLFGSRDPEAVIRSAAEAVLRELAAGEAFLDLLTANRAGFERQALARLEQRLAVMSEGQLGIALDGLTLHDLHPPQEVVGSYHAVAEAIQKRDRQVNEAEAEATRSRRRAEEDALRTVRQAEAEACRKVADATAARDVFLAWQRERTELSPDEEAALARELESRTKAGEDHSIVAKEIDTRRKRTLETRRFLTDFRLSLQATVGVLAGRDKILIDADNLPGKRHLMLADPEGFKLPPGIMRPPEKE